MGIVDQLTGVIKTGKEANVYHAMGPTDMPTNMEKNGSNGSFGQNIAVKIFKTTLSGFKNRVEYVEGDPRYAKFDVSKLGDRKLIKLWAEKEWRNLQRIHQAGILCPKPLMLQDHVLAMAFIGDENGRPSPQLAQFASRMSGRALRACYLDVIIAIRQLYQKCSLVHADLSECNLLYQQEKNKTYVIDVGQAVEKSHPKADIYLARDARQVTKFFYRKGISNALPWPVLCLFVVETDPALTCEGKELQMEHSLLEILQKEINEDTNANLQNKFERTDDWRHISTNAHDIFCTALRKLRAESGECVDACRTNIS